MSSDSHVELGQVLIAIAEPHRETLDTYHRWFERDHMYSAVLVGPGAFAANRYVAPRRLKALRYPEDGQVFPALDHGSFVALYFISAGMVDEHFAWSYAQSAELGRQGRNDPNRDLTLTWLCDYQGSVASGTESVPPEVVLDHPYPGLVMVWVDRDASVPLDALRRWLEAEALPRALPGSSTDRVLIFAPRNFPAPDPRIPLTPGTVNDNPRVGESLLLLYFLEEEPAAAWQGGFATLGDEVVASGLGRVALAAPFVPTPRGRRADPAELW